MLGAVFLLGLALRLWGITWGLPNREHYFSYHPDEILILRASQAADVWAGRFNPHFYNYGSLQIYLNSLFRPFAYAALAPGIYTDYLLGRVLTAFMGAGTVLLAYGIARRMGGRVAGILAAFLMAIAPAHVLHSHYVTVDVPATFWVMLALYACLRVNGGKSLRWSLLAGAAGLAAGTKYNAGVVLLPVLLAHLPRISSAWKSVLAFGAALFLSTPGMLLWRGEFWRDFGYELAHTRQGHAWVFVDTPPAWLFHWVKNLRWGLGLPLLLLVTAGLISACVHLWGLRGKERAEKPPGDSRPSTGLIHPYLLLLSFIAPYYLVIGTAEVKFLRYTIPLIPPLLILLSAEAARLWSGLASRNTTDSVRKALLGVGGVAAVYTLLYSLGFTGLLARVPPQDAALKFLLDNASGHSLGLTTVPWFYSPPVSPYNAGPQSAVSFDRHRSESPFRLSVLGMDADRLDTARPDYLALSEYETTDILRLAADSRERNDPALTKSKQFLERVSAEYQVVFQARNRPGMLPSWLLPADEPPHDWLYPYPTETIWKRR